MFDPLGAGSYTVFASLSGLKICDARYDPNDWPLTFSITRPRIRYPVLIYE